jgi:hypothetical protein
VLTMRWVHDLVAFNRLSIAEQQNAAACPSGPRRSMACTSLPSARSGRATT